MYNFRSSIDSLFSERLVYTIYSDTVQVRLKSTKIMS